MRTAATAATLLFALASCSTTEQVTVSPYQQANSLMSAEINQRIEQIPYQHREELVQNLLWLQQIGEQSIPALIRGLKNENAKVRSSCCWVLGRLRDRRTVPDLQKMVSDSEDSVRMEAARSLVLMGDLDQSPKLIAGLDSDRTEVRYMCHEALKSATGHDFGYDHLNQSQQELQLAVLRWRSWWGEYSGDQFFAASYEKEHGLNNFAVPGGETKPAAPQAAPQAPTQPAETNVPSASPDGKPQSAPVEVPPSVGGSSNDSPAAEVPPASGSAAPETVESNSVEAKIGTPKLDQGENPGAATSSKPESLPAVEVPVSTDPAPAPKASEPGGSDGLR